MFKENKKHISKSLFGFGYYLTKKKYTKLMESAEYTFYKLIFCNIDEKQGWSYKTLLQKQKNRRAYYFTEEDYFQNRREMRILEIPPERRMNHKGKLKVRCFLSACWNIVSFSRKYSLC